jgi:mono/diheme cytochrome c family protein
MVGCIGHGVLKKLRAASCMRPLQKEIYICSILFSIHSLFCTIYFVGCSVHVQSPGADNRQLIYCTTDALHTSPYINSTKTNCMLSGNKKVTVALFLAATTLLTVRCTSNSETEPNTTVANVAQAQPAVSVERGEYLVTAGGCNDCHSPKNFGQRGPMIDSTRLLSGHPADAPLPKIDVAVLKPGGWVNFSPDLTAIVGPWGMTYAANLTSDSATGIGAWSEANFIGAMRKGKHMGADNGRPIMPPMPWENLARLTDDDLKSIFAYLKSTPAISNRVHEPFSPSEVMEMAKRQ